MIKLYRKAFQQLFIYGKFRLQNSCSQTHTCTEVLSIKLQTCSLNFIAIKKKLQFRCFTVNFAKFCGTLFTRTLLGGYFFKKTSLGGCFLIEHLWVALSKMNEDALEKCFLCWIMPLMLINVFDKIYLKLTSPDHTSSK